MRPNEGVGTVVGALLAPVTGAIALVRKARMFHPEGAVYRAEVTGLRAEGESAVLADRLSGPALVRMSSAWWRGGKDWTDVLGCAVRFRSTPEPSPQAAEGDQDLLFATIRSPWTMLPAALTTHIHDFLANDYYAVSPFFVRELGKVKWRLVSAGESHARGDRAEKLETAVRKGRAVFHLQARHLGLGKKWRPVAELRLLERVVMDQAALRFSPFRTGRGIEPRGWIHALRHATYASSRALRPTTSVPA